MLQLYVKQLHILKTVMYVYNVYNGGCFYLPLFFAVDSEAFGLGRPALLRVEHEGIMSGENNKCRPLQPAAHLAYITPGKLFLRRTPRQQLKTHLLIQ